jgi:hypothetical protein
VVRESRIVNRGPCGVGGVYAGRMERTAREAQRLARYMGRKGEYRQAFDLYLEASRKFLEAGEYIMAAECYGSAEICASYMRPPAKIDPEAFVD